MIQLWKETLLAGEQIDARSKKRFRITPNDVKAALRNMRRMVDKGRNIPLVYEHQDVEECDPEEWKAHYARNTFGRVGGARLSTLEDVNAGLANQVGSLLVRHDVYSEEDAKAVKRAGYVSPKIYRDYLDSQGEEYDGLTVAHVAATPTACQFWQKPFELSDGDAFYLAYPMEREEFAEIPSVPAPEEECTDYAKAFLEYLDALEMSATEEESPVADDKEESGEKEEKGENGGGGKGKKTLMDVIKALRDTGMSIPDEVEDETGLIIAIKASSGTGGGAKEPEENPDENLDSTAETTEAAGGPPMVMSTLDADPKKRAVAQTHAKPERQEALARIEAAFKSGRLSPPDYRACRRQALAFEMSFTRDYEVGGRRWKSLLDRITEIEQRPANSVYRPNGQTRVPTAGLNLSTTEIPAPTELDQDQSPGLEEALAETRRLAAMHSARLKS